MRETSPLRSCGGKVSLSQLGDKMKVKALQNMLDNITASYPDANLKIQGKEIIFSSDKESGEVEWSHTKVKSIEIEFTSEPVMVVVKL